MSPSDEETSRRSGMPEPNSVVTEKTFTPERRTAQTSAASERESTTYRIIRSSEMDPYDEPLQPEEVDMLGVERFAGVGDAYRGKDRKAAKLSIAAAQVEGFEDIKVLIETLPSEEAMISHDPPITIDPESDRVEEEDRNVRFRAFLYAASREADNDFHLIVGRDPQLDPMYMTMEVSGLPPEDSEYFSKLKATRDAYKEFFGDHLPGASYDFYDPPIPIEVEGSLFFDMTHSANPPDKRPGPHARKPRTIWETHPVTNILFEP